MRLLLVEDDRILRIPVRDALTAAGFEVQDLGDGAAALRAAESQPFDVVLSDVRLPGLDGLGLLRRLRVIQPDLAVLLMTAHADAGDAVAAIREGARDYIVKPFELDELVLRIGRVREELEFRRRMAAGGPQANRAGPTIRGVSTAVQRLLAGVEAAAGSDANVLISGETGTGKDLCARIIHERSRRTARPFVAVNCAAIPDTLFEAEVFGHEKGAFTGADRRRIGRFELADGGTLFLDEVGELSLPAQVKLLRVLEARSFEPVGSSQSIQVDVRVIAATNRDLAADVARGAFRSDLYFRLNVIDLATPPLRQRRSDIPILVKDFLTEIAARQGRPVPALDPAAVAALATYAFPGNVRELLHALERAVAMSRGDIIRLSHLPSALGGATGGTPEDESAALQPLTAAVEAFEGQYIRHVLAKVGGHRGRAAQILGISRKALWQRLRGQGDAEPEDEAGA